MYCSKHNSDNNLCGCTLHQIGLYESHQVRLAELDMMEGELQDTAESADPNVLRNVLLDLVRLIRKEMMEK